MDIDQAVRSWYAAPSRFGPQNKDAGWAEYILVDGGARLRGRRVLNLGCFYPEDELRFAATSASWTAIDFAPEVIERCRAMDIPGASFVVMDMRVLDFVDGSFDIVLDSSSGDHLLRDDFLRCAREVYRVLRPGGEFVVAYSNQDWFVAQGYADPSQGTDAFGYWRADTHADMRAMLESCGFEYVSCANQHTARSGMLVRRPT